MPARKNLIGCVFGRWTVIDYAGPGPVGATWTCICECGSERVVNANSLMAGTSVSCGCYAREVAGTLHTTHGHNTKKTGQSPTYKSWRNMLRRCTDAKHPSYPNYGGRGITVCEEWKLFINFLSDMGERPDTKTLDRIDSDKGYSKANCQWMTMREQANNTARNTWLTHEGETLTIAEWARKIGVAESAIRARVYRGKSAAEALSTVVQVKHPKG